MKNPHVIFIVLDTVRYDRLAINGYNRVTMPTLESLAPDTYQFKNAFTNAPWTLPAHASIFSGRYPSEHGATQKSLRVQGKTPLLAEILRDELHYQTWLFATNAWFAPETGLVRGFQHIIGNPIHQNHQFRRKLRNLRFKIQDRIPGFTQNTATRRAVSKMIELLHKAGPQESPLFLFANFMDAHTPLRVSRAAINHFFGDDERWQSALKIAKPITEHKHVSGNLILSEDQLVLLSDLYDAALFDLDLSLRSLLEAVQSEDMRGKVLLIIASDHGEHLGEHGLLGHQFSVYDSVLHVPLFIYWPGVIMSGVSDALVQLSDLYHTILTVLNLPNAERYHILPQRNQLAVKPEDKREAILAEYARPVMSIRTLLQHACPDDVSHLDRELAAIRTKQYKYISVGVDEHPGELYDVANDPDEQQNLVNQRAEVASSMRQNLLTWRERLRTDQNDDETGLVVEDMDAAVVKRLQKLGYLE